jgi:sRNA-binding regulator protein Hfq
MNPHLLDALFSRSLAEGKPLRLLLRSHHQLVGCVKGFDSYVLLLERKSGGGATKNPALEIVYRHALAAVSLDEAPLAVSQPTRAPQQKSTSTPPWNRAERRDARSSAPARPPVGQGAGEEKSTRREAATRHPQRRHASQPTQSPARRSASQGEKREERMNLSMEEEIRKWIRNQGLPEPKPQ